MVAAAESEEARIRALYRIIFQRPPDADEIDFARRFEQRPEDGVETNLEAPLSRWAQLAQVLLSANELAFVD